MIEITPWLSFLFSKGKINIIAGDAINLRQLNCIAFESGILIPYNPYIF